MTAELDNARWDRLIDDAFALDEQQPFFSQSIEAPPPSLVKPQRSLASRVADAVAGVTRKDMLSAIMLGGSLTAVMNAAARRRAVDVMHALGEKVGHHFHGNQWTEDTESVVSDMRAPTTADAARLKALVIPPAWKNVRISADPRADLQVTGIDAKGRTQYRYSAEHSERAAGEKFARLREFNRELPALRQRMRADLRDPNLSPADRAAASVLYLIDKTGFRVGSDRETGGDVQAFGASTLRTKHVDVEDTVTNFDFVGKKGVHITKSVDDATLASIIKDRIKNSADGRLFDTTDSAVRDYLHERDGHFKVKDFRTWHGTQLALSEVNKMPVPSTKTELAKAQRRVSTIVAAHLGNTPTVARASYIDPAVWSRWKT